MERLTEASPNGGLIAIGNVMSGGLQPIERLEPRRGYKRDGGWVRRCTVFDRGGRRLARENGGAGVREIPAARRPSQFNPPGAGVPNWEKGAGRLPLNGARRMKPIPMVARRTESGWFASGGAPALSPAIALSATAAWARGCSIPRSASGSPRGHGAERRRASRHRGRVRRLPRRHPSESPPRSSPRPGGRSGAKARFRCPTKPLLARLPPWSRCPISPD
jgi:hypothetical protein